MSCKYIEQSKSTKKWKPKHSLSTETHKAVYQFWLQENAIVSTDRRSGRDEARISKLEYLRDYAHCINICDTNITEKEIVLRKPERRRNT